MKKNIIYIFTLLCMILTAACNSQSWQPAKGGFIVQVEQPEGDMQRIRLQAVNDRIIRVSATPEKEFSSVESLIRVPELEYAKEYDIDEDEQYLILTTAALIARVDRRPRGFFSDKEGNLILREKGRRKIIYPY